MGWCGLFLDYHYIKNLNGWEYTFAGLGNHGREMRALMTCCLFAYVLRVKVDTSFSEDFRYLRLLVLFFITSNYIDSEAFIIVS